MHTRVNKNFKCLLNKKVSVYLWGETMNNRCVKSIGDYILLLVSMVALFVTYFIWQPYNKCMIQTGDSDIGSPVANFITRVLFYALCFAVVILFSLIIFERNEKIRFEIKSIEIAKTVAVMFALRIGVDVLNLIVISALRNEHKIATILASLLEIIYDVLLPTVPVAMLAYKRSKQQINKFVAVGTTIIMIVATILYYFLFFAYCYDSMIECKTELLAICRDTVFVFIAYVMLSSFYFLSNESSTNRNKGKAFIIRIVLIALVFAVVNFIKFAVLPVGMIRSTLSVDGMMTDVYRIESYSDMLQNLK